MSRKPSNLNLFNASGLLVYFPLEIVSSIVNSVKKKIHWQLLQLSTIFESGISTNLSKKHERAVNVQN